MIHKDVDSLKQYKNKGYIVSYYPSHPNSWKGCGLIYYHRLVIENELGRILNSKEHVHHINGDILDNRPENLAIVTGKSHPGYHKRLKKKKCIKCKKLFQPNNSKRKFCSLECASKNAERIKWPSDNELKKLVWAFPLSRLSNVLRVSDVSIRKRCESRGISRPPQGYWLKSSSKNMAESSKNKPHFFNTPA